jgi:hypothetical protein
VPGLGQTVIGLTRSLKLAVFRGTLKLRKDKMGENGFSSFPR